MSTTQQTKQRERRPNSMLELYMETLAGRTGDPFLDEINLGTGNYSRAEYWEQVRSFRNGIYAENAAARHVLKKAEREAKQAIVDAIYDAPDSHLLDGIEHPPADGLDREEYHEEYAEEIWANLGTENLAPSEHRAVLVNETTGIPMDWTPPHHRMLKMRHEASQSKGARAMDNLFERVKEFVGDGAEEFTK